MRELAAGEHRAEHLGLLAFAEGRKFGCGDFTGQHDMVMRKSSDDGLTWGPLHTIVDAISFHDDPGFVDHRRPAALDLQRSGRIR